MAAAVAAMATASFVGGSGTAAAAARNPSQTTDQLPVINADGSQAPSTAATGIGGGGQGITHTVQPGDTLFKIARAYGVPLQSVIAANNFANPNLIYPGEHVNVPVDGSVPAAGGGLSVEVQPGDTVWILSQRYGVDPQQIIEANQLANPDLILPGQTLIIPGASGDAAVANAGGADVAQPAAVAEAPAPAPEPEPAPAQQVSSTFIWPARGTLTQYYGPTNFWMEPAYQGHAHFHQGIDIGNSMYTPILAAAAGTVTFAGWNNYGYGYMVEIDHGNGFTTLYAHMAEHPPVSVGQWVAQGQHIGPMGSTGASTGPHLHFGVKQNGVWVDPMNFLP